jgi:hypothetical protein
MVLMHITLDPLRRDGTLTVAKQGDILTINGNFFDFSALPNGASYPASEVDCPWITGDVERIGGVLHITLVLPIGPNPSPGVAFPAPIINPPDGPIALPRDEEEVFHVDA